MNLHYIRRSDGGHHNLIDSTFLQGEIKTARVMNEWIRHSEITLRATMGKQIIPNETIEDALADTNPHKTTIVKILLMKKPGYEELLNNPHLLFIAIEQRLIELVRIFLLLGVQTNIVNKDGDTPLMSLTKILDHSKNFIDPRSYAEFVKLMFCNVDINYVNLKAPLDQSTCLAIVVGKEHGVKTARILLAHGADFLIGDINHPSASIVALIKDDRAMLDLFEESISVSLTNRLLCYLSKYPDNCLLFLIDEYYYMHDKNLISEPPYIILAMLRRPDIRDFINYIDSKGRTPLSAVAIQNDTKLLKLLLLNGADPILINDGMPLIHRLVMGNHVELINLLIEISPRSMNLIDSNGETANSLAFKMGITPMIRILKK